ncbi:hypothetical protein TNCV_2673171 [Trichonephila clavipes]|nr:hypothetical protein TNCV_2673171 [Trichonephila clavipes]
MKLTEKLISENHRDEFSATSGKPSISPSPLRLTSMHFSDVIPASEKKSNPTRQCSRDCAPVIEIPEISQVHTGYFSNIPKCIKAEFIASWACSQSSVVSSSKR